MSEYDHMLIVPVDGPVHVYCGTVDKKVARNAIETLGDGVGNMLHVNVAIEGFDACDYMFLMNPEGTSNPRAGRVLFDLCGMQAYFTGPAAFLNLTEYATGRVVQALSI